MKFFNIVLLLNFSTLLFAQSFYTLTGIKSYKPMFISMVKSIDKEVENSVLASIEDMSEDLKVTTNKESSRVLVVLLKNIYLGKSRGIKAKLQLVEYPQRVDTKEQIFAITYYDTKIIASNESEDIIDSIDDMLEKFSLEYEDDNKNSIKSKSITHKNFAKVMRYETNYYEALAKAKITQKPLFVFMSTNYCPWCRKLENRVLSKENINNKIQNKYVPVMLNLDKKDFPKYLQQISFTPILYIVNPNNQKIEYQFVGYGNKNGFISLLNESLAN